eukprot:4326549-Heterocapsa_arctica.AAC.1
MWKHNQKDIENQGERWKQDETYDKDINKEHHRMKRIRGKQRIRREKKRMSRGGGKADEEEQQRVI